MRDKQLKEAEIIKAEGEAKAAELISEVSTKGGAGLVALRKLEASIEMAAKTANNPNIFYIRKDMPNFILILNTAEDAESLLGINIGTVLIDNIESPPKTE